MSSVATVETRNRSEIKKWIESRGGVPARLAYESTGREYDPLAVWFRNEEKDVPQTYQELDWEEFFAIMEHYGLAFQYEKEGKDDRFYRFVQV